MVKAEPKQNVRRKKRTTTEITGPLDDDEDNSDEPRQSKRVRLQHQPFQSPQVLSSMIPQYFRMSSQSSKPSADDKIEVFDKGDFLAVRNEDGTFFVCRTAQKVYKSSRRFKVRWLNDDDKKPGQFTLDFYDMIDFDCVLTNLRMDKVSKGVYKLPADERKRALNILERALNVEKGVSDVPDPRKFTEDGVDVSFVGKEEEKAFLESSKPTSKSESQKETPKKKAGRPKRTRSEPSESEADQDDDDSDVSEEYTPRKTKSREKIVEKERPKLKKIIIKEKEKSRKDKNKSSKKKEKKEKEAPAEVSSKKDKKTKESKKEDKEKSKKKTHKHSEKVPESKADKSRPALPPTTTKRMKTAEKTPKFKLTTTSAATTSAREAKRTTRSSGSSPKKTTPTNKSNRSG
ncbi:hypothetical protein HDE_05499 [Halotydeus destructor]|nr:hypothetical protein HDE_05499 [Halotydeus destructor]